MVLGSLLIIFAGALAMALGKSAAVRRSTDLLASPRSEALRALALQVAEGRGLALRLGIRRVLRRAAGRPTAPSALLKGALADAVFVMAPRLSTARLGAVSKRGAVLVVQFGPLPSPLAVLIGPRAMAHELVHVLQELEGGLLTREEAGRLDIVSWALAEVDAHVFGSLPIPAALAAALLVWHVC